MREEINHAVNGRPKNKSRPNLASMPNPIDIQIKMQNAAALLLVRAIGDIAQRKEEKQAIQESVTIFWV